MLSFFCLFYDYFDFPDEPANRPVRNWHVMRVLERRLKKTANRFSIRRTASFSAVPFLAGMLVLFVLILLRD